jgi:hypothetical protein
VAHSSIDPVNDDGAIFGKKDVIRVEIPVEEFIAVWKLREVVEDSILCALIQWRGVLNLPCQYILRDGEVGDAAAVHIDVEGCQLEGEGEKLLSSIL